MQHEGTAAGVGCSGHAAEAAPAHTWKQAPSTRPNSPTASQPVAPVGSSGRLSCHAQASSTPPAGSRRHAARAWGVVWGPKCFMATMLVPQKKKGEISSATLASRAAGPAERKGHLAVDRCQHGGQRQEQGRGEVGRQPAALAAAVACSSSARRGPSDPPTFRFSRPAARRRLPLCLAGLLIVPRCTGAHNLHPDAHALHLLVRQRLQSSHIFNRWRRRVRFGRPQGRPATPRRCPPRPIGGSMPERHPASTAGNH